MSQAQHITQSKERRHGINELFDSLTRLSTRKQIRSKANAGKRCHNDKCCSKPSVLKTTTDALAKKRPATWRDLRALGWGVCSDLLASDFVVL
jgi:hypothetical protein